MLLPRGMIYLKSVLAGVAAVIAALVLTAAAFAAWGWWTVHRAAQEAGAGVGAVEVNTPWIVIPAPILVAVAFFLGFCWQWRKAKRNQRAVG